MRSCCVLWIRVSCIHFACYQYLRSEYSPKNGGTNCPACRGVSTSVTPSRPLQSIIDVLLRADPSRTRAPRERLQANEIYQSGPIRVSVMVYMHTMPSEATFF